MKRITDPSFRYKPSYDTDIRKTFERIKKRDNANAKEVERKVEPIPKRKAA